MALLLQASPKWIILYGRTCWFCTYETLQVTRICNAVSQKVYGLRGNYDSKPSHFSLQCHALDSVQFFQDECNARIPIQLHMPHPLFIVVGTQQDNGQEVYKEEGKGETVDTLSW
jgi:hypothetical protein